MNTGKHILVFAALATTLLAACGSRRPAVNEPEPPQPSANATNTVIVPTISYRKTAKGLQLSK